ncbi:MAG: recombinational DNA repair protein (RecF pathway) [Patiriisocius sp.]|jgi:recombinational DNA repair protein (RecF pathway)
MKALVCGSRDSYTSDKSYLLFTKEEGMLWATARSVRVEKSKQRMALQDFSIIRVSLVKGKGGWRIGSVEALSNAFLAAENRMVRGGISYIVKALRQYVHGEVEVPRAFLDMQTVLLVLDENTSIEGIAAYQQLFILRLLDELGYIAIPKELCLYVETKDITEAFDIYDSAHDARITQHIEHAKKVSHL